jgi:glycosyltransferase involved in cell wall biosynthesis
LFLFPGMLNGKRIAVVVPAFNEADKIGRTIRSIPGFVDHVLVVDDGSRDATARIAGRSARRGLEVLAHPRNRGVGAAIATGYRRALALDVDATAVMAGDAQMDPADLLGLLGPVLADRADYAKGNRLAWPNCWRQMPPSRYLGNLVLSFLTRLACGQHVRDSQCGYTVASPAALRAIDPDAMFARYGYPNDLLGRLLRARARVLDVPVRPVYGSDWRSGIRIRAVILPLLFLLGRAFLRRIWDAGLVVLGRGPMAGGGRDLRGRDITGREITGIDGRGEAQARRRAEAHAGQPEPGVVDVETMGAVSAPVSA